MPPENIDQAAPIDATPIDTKPVVDVAPNIPDLSLKTPLPVATLPAGATLTTQGIPTPVGAKTYGYEFDGSTWPAGVDVTITLKASEDGGITWTPRASITTNAASLKNGKCSLSLNMTKEMRDDQFITPNGNQNPNHMSRYSVTTSKPHSIDVISNVTHL